MPPDVLKQKKKELEAYALLNKTTAEQGIPQDDGSIIVIRSVQGKPCEEFKYSAEERELAGWPEWTD